MLINGLYHRVDGQVKEAQSHSLQATPYLHGNHVRTVTVANGGSINTANPRHVGRAYATFTEYLQEPMDGLAIWNEPPSQTPIQNAMNYGAQTCLAPPPAPPRSLLQ